MGKRLECRDIAGCDYSVCTLTTEEAIQKVGEHIRTVHEMKGFSKEFYQKAQQAIREAKCSQEMSNEELLCEACDGVCLC